jgi:hypothetical protein
MIRVHLGLRGFRRHELVCVRACWTIGPRRHWNWPSTMRRAGNTSSIPRSERVLRQMDLLQRHTVETQEIAEIILATALIARERGWTANGQVPVLRLKCGVVLAITRSLWFFLGPCEDLLNSRACPDAS